MFLRGVGGRASIARAIQAPQNLDTLSHPVNSRQEVPMHAIMSPAQFADLRKGLTPRRPWKPSRYLLALSLLVEVPHG